MSLAAARVKEEPEYVLPDQVPIEIDPELSKTNLLKIELEALPQDLFVKTEPVCDAVAECATEDHTLGATNSTEVPCVLQNVVSLEKAPEFLDVAAVCVKDAPGLPPAPARAEPHFRYEVPLEPPLMPDVKPNIRECRVRLERGAPPAGRLTTPLTSPPTTPPTTPRPTYTTADHERQQAIRQLSTLLIKPASQTYPYYCHICTKGFKYPSHLTKHRQVHSKTPYKKRQAVFNRIADRYISTLSTQKQSSINLKKTYGCEFCTAVFSDLDSVKLHAQNHANINVRLRCEFCNKVFSSRVVFREHHRTHRDSRPHKCHVCKVKFAQTAYLSKHMLSKHNKVPLRLCKACESKLAIKQLGNLMAEVDLGVDTELCERCKLLR